MFIAVFIFGLVPLLREFFRCEQALLALKKELESFLGTQTILRCIVLIANARNIFQGVR